MLSESFKKRINRTTDLKSLKDEIKVMNRIVVESHNQAVEEELSEKITYIRDRIRKLEG